MEEREITKFSYAVEKSAMSFQQGLENYGVNQECDGRTGRRTEVPTDGRQNGTRWDALCY